MVFELGGFANLTDEFSANLTVKYGSWTEAAGNYSFTEDPDETASSLNFTDKTVGEVVGLINDLADVEAQIVDTTGEGTSYSVIITSANTGFENGFQITGADRWATPDDPGSHGFSNSFSQLSSNASFELDGVAVTRKRNSITDLIDGASIELKSDFTEVATVGISRSEDAVRQTVQDVIFFSQ